MPKINYLRSLISSLSGEEVNALVEEYAKRDKSFEAFLLEKSGQAVDTGKSYEEYHEELNKVLKRCKTRRGFFKVTRLKNAGMNSFQKLLNSHFKNENFSTALWMSLALMEMMQEVILMNTRYQWGNKPYKTFEKILLECRDQFDSSIRFARLARKDRPQLFRALIRCWWRERERDYDHTYFETDDVFKYVKRDEDLMAIQIYLKEIKPRAQELDKKNDKKSWQKILLGGSKNNVLFSKLNTLENRVKKELDRWD